MTATVVTARSPHHQAPSRGLLPGPRPGTVTVHLTLHGDAPDVAALLHDLAPHLSAVRYTLAPAAEPRLTPVPADLPDPDTVVLDTSGRTVTRAGDDIVLCRREFDLLLFLARHPGQVFTRQQLLTSVWGDAFSGPRTVDVHVTRLRRKLGTTRPVVGTVRGVGYRLEPRAPVRVVTSVRRTGRRTPPHTRTAAA